MRIGFASAEGASADCASADRERLAWMGVTADEIALDHPDPILLTSETPREFVLRRAEEKAWQARRSDSGDRAILAAARVVARGRRILPRARTPDEARACLRLLSGCGHRVYAGLCLIEGEAVRRRIACSRIVFKRLGEEEIAAYLDSGEWQDQKGGYRFSGRAMRFARFVSGAPGTIEGLPLFETASLLSALTAADSP